MDIKLKWASSPAEMEWVNETYRSIQFQTSDLGTDHVLLATDGQDKTVGVGRLIPINSVSWELGGIYVTPNARGNGIARRIVQQLVQFASTNLAALETLWCIPFAHLLPFYSSFGFQKVNNTNACGESLDLPPKIRSKLSTCGCTFRNTPTVLLRMEPRNVAVST